MKTTLAAISLIVAFSVLSSVTVSAQSLYSSSSYFGSCVNLSRNLSYDVRGSDVTQLQVFLVSQNFPGGGSWMETGLYGAATTAAVRDFQQEAGVPQTGIVDVSTRAAISQMTCGGSVAYVTPATTVYPINQTIPWNQYGNNYPYNNNGYVSLNLTSLSQNTGSIGTQVTIYGTGFDASNNTINFGSVALTNVPSNGTSLTFIVPSYTISGIVNISVTDSRGTSNALAFTVNAYGYTCGNNYFSTYGSYGQQCGCNNTYTTYPTYTNGTTYPYNTNNNYGNCGTTNPPSNVLSPTVTYLTPISGAVGTSVTILGSGFTTSGNTVHFGTGVIAGLISSNGQSVSFNVPTQLNGYGTQNTGLGIYNVSVTNGDGYSTNSLPFTVTSLGSNGSTVSITNVNGPSSIPAGTVGTWTVTVNNPSNTAVTVTPLWGDTNIYPYNGTVVPQTSTQAGTVTLTFTHVYSTNGTYAVSFTASNGNGTQTSAAQTVVVTGSNGYNNGVPTISYISPNSGYVGQQVTIYGSNFASSNRINFGNGALQNVYSNGSIISFTVPSSVGPYCAPGTACPQYLISITPGTYNVSVMNSNGTSNIVPFTVQ